MDIYFIMNPLFRTTASAARTLSRSRFQPFNLPSLYLRPASTMSHSVPKLNDPSLLKTDVAYVNGEWVKAKSGKTFEVHGMASLWSLFRNAAESASTRPLFWQTDRNCPRIRRRRYPESYRCCRCRIPRLQSQDRPRTVEASTKVVRFDGMIQWDGMKGEY